MDELGLEVVFEGVIRRHDETELQSDSKMGQGGAERRREVSRRFLWLGQFLQFTGLPPIGRSRRRTDAILQSLLCPPAAGQVIF